MKIQNQIIEQYSLVIIQGLLASGNYKPYDISITAHKNFIKRVTDDAVEIAETLLEKLQKEK